MSLGVIPTGLAIHQHLHMVPKVEDAVDKEAQAGVKVVMGKAQRSRLLDVRTTKK